MTLTLTDLTAEEMAAIEAAERKGIRFSALVKGLIAGLRQTTEDNGSGVWDTPPPDDGALAPTIPATARTAKSSSEEFRKRLKALSEGTNDVPVLPLEASSREWIYQDHD